MLDSLNDLAFLKLVSIYPHNEVDIEVLEDLSETRKILWKITKEYITDSMYINLCKVIQQTPQNQPQFMNCLIPLLEANAQVTEIIRILKCFSKTNFAQSLLESLSDPIVIQVY